MKKTYEANNLTAFTTATDYRILNISHKLNWKFSTKVKQKRGYNLQHQNWILKVLNLRKKQEVSKELYSQNCQVSFIKSLLKIHEENSKEMNI